VSLSISDRHIVEMFDYHEQMHPFQVLPSFHKRYGLMTLNGEFHHSQ